MTGCWSSGNPDVMAIAGQWLAGSDLDDRGLQWQRSGNTRTLTD